MAELKEELRKAVIKAQADEETGVVLYSYLAERQKDENNRKIFRQMAQDEQKHAGVWKSVTKEEVRPKGFHIFWLKLLSAVLGFTFVVKRMQKDEQISGEIYENMKSEIPQAAMMLEDERRHEKSFTACWTKSVCIMWEPWSWA